MSVRLRHHEEGVDCAGTGHVLVPSVMMSLAGCAVLTERAQPTVFSPAQGVGEGWHRGHADASAALTALLGHARARLLLELQRPLSTSECARLVDDAVSTASHHLTVLHEAGLVDSHRRGTRVLHTVTPLGEALAGRPCARAAVGALTPSADRRPVVVRTRPRVRAVAAARDRR